MDFTSFFDAAESANFPTTRVDLEAQLRIDGDQVTVMETGQTFPWDGAPPQPPDPPEGVRRAVTVLDFTTDTPRCVPQQPAPVIE